MSSMFHSVKNPVKSRKKDIKEYTTPNQISVEIKSVFARKNKRVVRNSFRCFFGAGLCK